MRGANAWWHWQGANVTKSGITRDLQSMRDAGLSGATIFNIQDVGWDCEERMSTPLCPGLEYMNDKWWDMVSFAVAEAKRLGLELGLHNCPGYSTSGGPWITPELGMKKLVWAKGDQQPEAKLGFYRDIARVRTKSGVYRFGYTCTGKNTHPSPPDVEAGSLEADKMNAKAVGVHIDNLLNGLAAHGISASCPGLAFILMDSYEAGDASWTDDFAQEFMKRRGYDPVPFLPVIAKLGTDFGEEREERFRRDFERTKNELQTERHYKVFKERLNAAGFKFHLEPYSGPFDSYEATQFCDVPMTEFWVGLPFWAKEPSKGGACWFAGPIARALGRNVTGAESFTGYPIDDPFAITPRDLKIPLDATLARGVNRLSLHHWEHQPLGERWRPGYSMGPWGTHFGENQTWHEPAKGFYRYIQRCQALLQEGEMRCDALGLSFNDEDGTDTLPLSNFLTNTEVTAEGRLRVKSSGREYSLLFFEPSAERRFAGNTPWDAVEKKCFDLVRDYEKKGLLRDRVRRRRRRDGVLQARGRRGVLLRRKHDRQAEEVRRELPPGRREGFSAGNLESRIRRKAPHRRVADGERRDARRTRAPRRGKRVRRLPRRGCSLLPPHAEPRRDRGRARRPLDAVVRRGRRRADKCDSHPLAQIVDGFCRIWNPLLFRNGYLRDDARSSGGAGVCA